MYYNTTGLTGSELEQSTEEAKSQDQVILSIFKECAADKYISPFYVKSVLEARNRNILITSIRRSITTLTNENKLVKSDKATLKGVYGRPNYGWKLAS